MDIQIVYIIKGAQLLNDKAVIAYKIGKSSITSAKRGGFSRRMEDCSTWQAGYVLLAVQVCKDAETALNLEKKYHKQLSKDCLFINREWFAGSKTDKFVSGMIKKHGLT